MDFRCINASLGKKSIATFTKISSNQSTCECNEYLVTTGLFQPVYLENYVEILLHDHFSGCIEIANPSGVIYSSLGASPLGMKNDSLEIGNFNASLEMIVQ